MVSYLRFPSFLVVSYLRFPSGILVSMSIVSNNSLNLKVMDSRTARMMCSRVVSGFRPIRVVQALSSLIGVCKEISGTRNLSILGNISENRNICEKGSFTAINAVYLAFITGLILRFLLSGESRKI